MTLAASAASFCVSCRLAALDASSRLLTHVPSARRKTVLSSLAIAIILLCKSNQGRRPSPPSQTCRSSLAAPARRPAVQTLVAAAVPDHDRAAVVAARGVELEEEGGLLHFQAADGVGDGLETASPQEGHGSRHVSRKIFPQHDARGDLVLAGEELRGEPA